MHRFFPPVSGMKHASEYQLPHQQIVDPLGKPEFYGDFIPTSQHELQFSQDPAKPSEQQTSPNTMQFSQDPAKPSEQQTSPDTVLTCQHGQQWWYGKHFCSASAT